MTHLIKPLNSEVQENTISKFSSDFTQNTTPVHDNDQFESSAWGYNSCVL
jgi:hypothetical protein